MRTALVIGAALLALGLVTAHGWGGGWRDMGAHHEQMENILEQGSYQDLVDYRVETGMPMMAWVQSEEEFALAQERHDRIEQWREEHALPASTWGCPMMSDS